MGISNAEIGELASLTHSFLSIDSSLSYRPLRSSTHYLTLFSFQLVQSPQYSWVLHVQLVADVVTLNVVYIVFL